MIKNKRWNTRHGDAHNSDFYECESPQSFEVKQKLLKNIPVATYVAVDEDKNMYALTLSNSNAEAKDNTKRLVSFNQDGKLRWSSNMMLTSLTSVGLSEGKYLYVADGEFLFKLKTIDGTLVWKTMLKEETSAIMFLSEKEIVVLGINGNLYLYDELGVMTTPTLSLECKELQDGVGHDYMPNDASQIELFQNALWEINVDKSYCVKAVDRFFGRGVAAKNVPAINQKERILYLLTSDSTGDKSLLIALQHDNVSATYKRLFTTTLGRGSDSSPNLSFDNSRVYCTAATGELYSVDARSGQVYWTYQLDNSSSASINSTPDKCIYISIKDDIVCIKDNDDACEKLWQTNFVNNAQFEGRKKALVNSVLVISQNHVHGVIGYCDSIAGLYIPQSHALLTLGRFTGELVSSLDIAHECMCTPSFLDKNHLVVPSKPFYKGMKQVLNNHQAELNDRANSNEDFYGLVVYAGSNMD